MAASAWSVFRRAKHNLGIGSIDLSGTATLKCALFRTSASANISSNISVLSSVGAFTCAGSLDSTFTLGNITWTGNASAWSATRKFDCTDFVFTASGATIQNVRYAVVYQSASAGGGPLICYAALSTTQFNVSTSSILTVQLASGGIFTLL